MPCVLRRYLGPLFRFARFTGRAGHLLRRALPGARADLPQARLRAAGLPRRVQHDDRQPEPNRTASARAVPCLLAPSVAPATRYRSGQVALGCGPCGHGTPPVVRARARTSRAQARIASRVCCACARALVCGVRACASMYVLYPTHTTHATRTTHDRPDPTLRVHPSARQGRRIGSF
jgi:hypothetical protein